MIPTAAVADSEFARLLTSYGRVFNSVFLELCFMAIAGALVTLIGWIVIHQGIYPGLDQTVSQRGELHYQAWWANMASHPVAFFIQLLYYWTFVYFMLRHTAVGMIIFALLLNIRKIARSKGQLWLGFDSPWHDTVVPLRALRNVINDIIVSITIMLSALALGAFYVGASSIVIVALLAFYVVYNPLIVLIPTAVINAELAKSASEWQSKTLAHWHRRHERAGKTFARGLRRAMTDSELARTEYELARSLPRTVFDAWSLARNLIIYLIPVVGVIVAIQQ